MAIRVRERPSLRQSIGLVTPSGRAYRWGEDERDPQNVFSDLRHSDTQPGGYESAGLTLPRDPKLDYTDLERLSTATIYGAGGESDGEYRLSGAPSTSGDQMSLSPVLEGWQQHLEDNKSSSLLAINRELGDWRGPSRQRQVNLNGTYNPAVGPEVTADATTGKPALKLEVSGHIPGSVGGRADAFYDAGSGNLIGRIVVAAPTKLNVTGTTWRFEIVGADDDIYTGATSLTGDLDDALIATPTTYTLTTPQRWLGIIHQYAATFTGDENERWRMLQDIAVIGNHGLTLRGPAGEEGFLASDVLGHVVPRFAPLLNIHSDSIGPSSFIIGQLLFQDTTVGEMVRQTSRFELPHWGVWDKRELRWDPQRTPRKRWRGRIGPTQLSETGPSLDRLWESIIVEFTDVDGSTRTAGPPGSGADIEDAQLKDLDPENPANKLGIIRRDKLVMGTGVGKDAIAVGARFLEQSRLLDTSGQAQLVGFVEDDHGILYPYTAVKAGDTFTPVDASDPSERSIVRADKTRATRTCSIDLDAPPDGLAALLERLGVSLVRLGF